jgi:phage terminase small subunit
MGTRGPLPLPANVHRLRGNPSKLSTAQLEAGIDPAVEIPSCPQHLLPAARKEWKRIAPELEKLGLISKIDRAALALYCQEYAWWAWHEACLQRDIASASEKQAAFEAARAEVVARGEQWTGGEWAGGNGYMIETPNGNLTYNPHWVGRNKSAEKLSRFQAMFGMSPSARGRVTPSTNQLPLPGIQPPDGGFDAL